MRVWVCTLRCALARVKHSQNQLATQFIKSDRSSSKLQSSNEENRIESWRVLWLWPYRVAKTHRMPFLYRSFSQKSPAICESFVKIDLQLKASYGSAPRCSKLSTGWRIYIACLKLQGFFTKEPLSIWPFGGKWPINTLHRMDVRHPVALFRIYFLEFEKSS